MDTAHLLRLANSITPACEDPADTELLHRYTAGRDEAAFAELVRRNGPLVLRTCWHLLGDAGAEDAFQATFLLLARSAGRLTRPGSLAGWLHAVAVRIACRSRRAEVRRRKREIATDVKLVAPDDRTWREVREVLEVELAAMPEKYRVPLVLCYLQELSYEEAARRAACPVGALRGRLERGKAELRKRLERYGLAIGAPVLVLGAPAPISAALAKTTLETVMAMSVGGTVPPAVAVLINPQLSLRAAITAPVVVVVALALAVAIAAGAFLAADPPKVDPPKAPSPVTETATRLAVDRLGDPLPTGAIARLGTRRLFGIADARWSTFSPDGRSVATAGWHGVVVCDASTGRQLIERTNYYLAGCSIGWRADGTGVAVVRLPDRSLFISAFTDPSEKFPTAPLVRPGPGRHGPDGLEFIALSPDANQLAVIRDPDEKQFIIDLLPATVGKSVVGLKPLKTLGPFVGPCREIRYTPRGVCFLTGSWKEGDWTISVVDLEKNAIARSVTIPPPAYCVWGFMYSLSSDGRLAAIPLRPEPEKPGASTTNEHTGTIRVWDLEAIPFTLDASCSDLILCV